MDLTKTYTQADIDLIISSKLEENIHLDFKANGSIQNTPANKKEIGKDVSSFANSDGGIIIYGISEKANAADSVSGVDGNIYTKEWLEQTITYNADPKIENIVIDVIRYNGEITNSIYVVKIPKAYRPHMAKDGRYYKRHNFSNIYMEEYEVTDLYFRRNSADLEILEPKLSARLISGNNNYGTHAIKAFFELNITNLSDIVETIYKYEFSYNEYLYLDHFEYPNKSDIIYRKLKQIQYFGFIPNKPIFKDDILNICRFHVEMSKMPSPINWNIEIKLYTSSGCKTAIFDLSSYINIDGKTLNEIFYGHK